MDIGWNDPTLTLQPTSPPYIGLAVQDFCQDLGLLFQIKRNSLNLTGILAYLHHALINVTDVSRHILHARSRFLNIS